MRTVVSYRLFHACCGGRRLQVSNEFGCVDATEFGCSGINQQDCDAAVESVNECETEHTASVVRNKGTLRHQLQVIRTGRRKATSILAEEIAPVWKTTVRHLLQQLYEAYSDRTIDSVRPAITRLGLDR